MAMKSALCLQLALMISLGFALRLLVDPEKHSSPIPTWRPSHLSQTYQGLYRAMMGERTLHPFSLLHSSLQS